MVSKSLNFPVGPIDRVSLLAPRGMYYCIGCPESESNWKNALLLTKFLQVLPVTTTILEFSAEKFSSSSSPLFLQLTILLLSFLQHDSGVIPHLVIRRKLKLSSLETFNGQPI